MVLVLLKEGTEDESGPAQRTANIAACAEVANILKSTLGPRGSDKLIKGTVTNDGATIAKLLNVDHPAAKTLVDISLAQDAESGDGTTSVVVLAGSFLNEAKNNLDSGIAPQTIIRGFRNAFEIVDKRMDELKQEQENMDRDTLVRVAVTTLNSKLLASYGQFFGEMAADAVLRVKSEDDSLIGIKKVTGGSIKESFLVEGVAFKKCFSYAGFEQQPKSFKNPKILALNIELELKAERDNAEVRITDPGQYQSIVEAEWGIIYDKLEKCVATGAKVVLSRLPIGDLATQYFADREIFCAGRVPADDMKRLCLATGAKVQSVLREVPESALGTCGAFDEQQIGAERYNLFNECPLADTVTILLRGGAEQFIDEAERSVHDAICAVRRARKHTAVVAGGGAIEMALSKTVRDTSRTTPGKQQFVLNSYAHALECIPSQLASNAGYDSTDILNKLRFLHNGDSKDAHLMGVDIEKGDVCNTYEKFVWEPLQVKRHALSSATEAACLILSIDRTIVNPKSEQPGDNTPIPGRGGRGRGRGGRGRGRGM